MKAESYRTCGERTEWRTHQSDVEVDEFLTGQSAERCGVDGTAGSGGIAIPIPGEAETSRLSSASRSTIGS